MERGRMDGTAQGHADGHAAGRAEAEASLGPARDAFVAAAARLAATADPADGLAEVIAAAVRRLAAERAGQMIDALPGPFAARIDALADRVAQGVRAVTLRLHPDDLAAITPHLAGFDVLSGAEVTTDARLSRGDVEVRAEGIRLADLLEAGA
jgi:flagellar assembly protein FliH